MKKSKKVSPDEQCYSASEPAADMQHSTDRTEYIPYPKAMKLLEERLNATPEELAAWLSCGPVKGGLAAYLDANELGKKRRFNYSSWASSEKEYDPIAPLMYCWFIAEDIANFKPIERYIKGNALIERWGKAPNMRPEHYIRAKMSDFSETHAVGARFTESQCECRLNTSGLESLDDAQQGAAKYFVFRLMDYRPIYQGLDDSFYGKGNPPPIESGLFALSQIKEIEASDFGSEPVKDSVMTKAAPQQAVNATPSELGSAGLSLAVVEQAPPKWVAEARLLGEQYLRAWRAEGFEPTKQDAACYVEGECSTRGIYGDGRGEVLDAAYIERHALTGITGHKPGFKSKKPKVPEGKRRQLPQTK